MTSIPGMTNLPRSPAWPRYVRGMNYSPDFVQCVLSSAEVDENTNFGSRRFYSSPICVILNWIKNCEQFVARKRSKSRLGLGWRPALSFSWKKIIVCTQPLHFSKLDPVDLISVFWYQGKTFRYHISKWHIAHVDFDLNESRFPLATLRRNKKTPFNIVFFCCCMGHTQQASPFQWLVMPIFRLPYLNSFRGWGCSHDGLYREGLLIVRLAETG